MALDVVLRDEIRNALRAAEHSALSTLSLARLAGALNPDNEYVKGYEAGCHAMLKAIALDFGLVTEECDDQR